LVVSVNKKSLVLVASAVLLIGGASALVGAGHSEGDAGVTSHPVHGDTSGSEKSDCSHGEHEESGGDGTGCTAEAEGEDAGLIQGVSSAAKSLVNGVSDAFSNLFGSMPNNPPEPQGNDGGDRDENNQTGGVYKGDAA
jgi:hypothetical protein